MQVERSGILDFQLSYGDAYGNPKRVSSLIGLVVAPKPPESVISLGPNLNVSSPLSGLISTQLSTRTVFKTLLS